MRSALISIAGQPHADDGTPLAIAGKTLARRQLDFALAAGCERIIAIGHGAAAEAVALRHAAEGAGARFQVVGDSHGLLGMIGAADGVLVLAPGLLPDAVDALETLGGGPALLVLPAGAGVAAGFERIDLDRAWAGAALVPGSLAQRLAELPPDAEPASALMRAALQARIPERRLPEDALTAGSWSILAGGQDSEAAGRAWLKRHLPDVPAWSVSRWAGRQALSRCAGALLAAPRSGTALLAAFALLLALAVAAAAYGWPAIAFALLASAAPLSQLVLALENLRVTPFGPGRASLAVRLAPLLVDATFAACAALAIAGGWPHRLFPPLVLLGVLHLAPSGRADGWPVLLRDRAVLGVSFALAALFGAAEPAVMIAALALLAVHVAQSGARRG